MSEQTTLSPIRGEVITSVEPDAVFLEARNAYLLAGDALLKANQALDASNLVSANAANALSQATTAISLANTAQTTANNALASQVSVTGASMTGPLYVNSLSPSAPYEAAAKGYVDAQVSTVATDAINSVAVLKADKTYVDAQDTALQSQITTGANQITDLYTKLFPVGGIILWSGSIASIPSGWALCNGANGTPDLRARFVIGANTSTYTVGAVGGATTDTSSLNGAHTHNATITPGGKHDHVINVQGRSLNVNQIPSHTHTVYHKRNTPDGGSGDTADFDHNGVSGDRSYATAATGSGNSHDHPATSEASGEHSHNGTILSAGDHTHTVDIVPPYYALAYIMRLSS